MKKIRVLLLTFLIFYCFSFLVTNAVSAAKPTPSPDAQASSSAQTTDKQRQEQVNELRQRVATVAAQLRDKMRRGFAGQIKSITDTTLVLTTRQGNKTVLTDDQTSFLNLGANGKKPSTLADLAEGQGVVAFGILSQETGQLSASLILSEVLPVNIIGKVTAVDLKGGTVSVLTLKGDSFIVDVETYTKIWTWDQEKGLIKLGFSKIKLDDRVHVNGNPPTKTQGSNRFSANRILDLPVETLGISSSTPSSNPSSSPKASSQ